LLIVFALAGDSTITRLFFFLVATAFLLAIGERSVDGRPLWSPTLSLDGTDA
jgi:hypothetical protein